VRIFLVKRFLTVQLIPFYSRDAGYRWWDYQHVDEETEREHIQRTVQIHKDLIGFRPVGMYQGKVRRSKCG